MVSSDREGLMIAEEGLVRSQLSCIGSSAVSFGQYKVELHGGGQPGWLAGWTSTGSKQNPL